MLNFLTTQRKIIIIKGRGGITLGGVGYVYGLDGDDGYIVWTSPQTLRVVYINIYSFLHVNQTSVKWLKEKREEVRLELRWAAVGSRSDW